MRSFRRSELSDKEYDQLLNILAEWIKDMAYIKAKDQARAAMEQILEDDAPIKEIDTVTIHIYTTTTGNDLIMMIGRIRRPGAPIQVS